MSTRHKIVACALGELERNGLDGFSLRAVGAAAGLSAMAVYRHFKSKEDLLRAIGEEAFDSFQRLVTSIPDLPIDEWLRKVTHAYVAFALDDPGKFDACFVLRTHVERIYPQDFRSGKSPVISLTMERIQTAQAAGLMKPGDSLELALLLWAQLHGLVMLHRAGRFSLRRSAFLALCERATQSFVSGVLSAPGSSPKRKSR